MCDLDRFTQADLEDMHDAAYKAIIHTVDLDLAALAACNELPYPSPQHTARWAEHQVLKARTAEVHELFMMIGRALRERQGRTILEAIEAVYRA